MSRLINNSLFNRLFILLTLAVLSSCANSDSSETDVFLSNIKKDLAQGKTVVVYQMLNKDKTSEQYADWASYLNDFITSQVSNYKVYASDMALNTRLLNKKMNIANSYTLFLKKGKASYFYAGVIVEPMVYMAVENSYSNGAASPMLLAFLPEVIEINVTDLTRSEGDR